MPNRYVFAQTDTTVLVGDYGMSFLIRRGDAYHADDPIVRDHPSLFGDEPNVVTSPGFVCDPVVEQATAAPGERRRRG